MVVVGLPYLDIERSDINHLIKEGTSKVVDKKISYLER